VLVGVDVLVGVGVSFGVGVLVSVEVLVGVDVSFGVEVLVGVDVLVGVEVLVGDEVEPGTAPKFCSTLCVICWAAVLSRDVRRAGALKSSRPQLHCIDPVANTRAPLTAE
jgi:hypothetical protein